MKDTDKNDSNSINPKFKGGPLALEHSKITYLKNKDMLQKMNKKQLVFERTESESSLLDESQLKEQ